MKKMEEIIKSLLGDKPYSDTNPIYNDLLSYLIERDEEIERLNNIIDKVIEDLKNTKELNDKYILARDNIIVNLDIDHIDYLLDILKEK